MFKHVSNYPNIRRKCIGPYPWGVRRGRQVRAAACSRCPRRRPSRPSVRTLGRRSAVRRRPVAAAAWCPPRTERRTPTTRSSRSSHSRPLKSVIIINYMLTAKVQRVFIFICRIIFFSRQLRTWKSHKTCIRARAIVSWPASVRKILKYNQTWKYTLNCEHISIGDSYKHMK